MEGARLENFYPANRPSWRKWLEENHANSSGVWLVFYKKHTGKPSLTYEEAVEEALRFGWIDGRTNKLDEQRYLLHFSPRKPGSIWAKSNKRRVEKLLELGLMTPAGLRTIEAAQNDGSWNLLDSVDELILPEALQKALAGSKAANAGFNTFSDSIKRQVLWWIKSAKRPQTRETRIARVIKSAKRGKPPF